MTVASRRTTLRAVAAAFAIPALLGLTACGGATSAETEFASLQSQISGWPNIAEVSVSGSYNGLPTSRNLSLWVSVDDVSSVDLAALTDRLLAAAWSFQSYEPQDVSLSLHDAALPEPAEGVYAPTVDLTAALESLGLEEAKVGSQLVFFDKEIMTSRFGEWPGSGAVPE